MSFVVWSRRSLFALSLLASSQVVLAQRELKDIPIPDAEEERKTFVLPEGFEVNLFAADPGIHKPIQMNFNPQGRLWIAASEVNAHARQLYERLGFREIAKLDDLVCDGRAEILYRKRL